MKPGDILDNLGGGNTNIGIEFDISTLFKLPLILFLGGNILFVLILFLRIRILADIFDSPQNKIVKTILVIHIFLTLIGSIISLISILLS